MELKFRFYNFPSSDFYEILTTNLYLALTYWENLFAEYRISAGNMIGRIVPFIEPIYITRISLSGDL